jgi:dihydroorotase
METVLKALTVNPSRRFVLSQNGWSVWDLNESYAVDPADFVSMGKASPFTGMEVYGRNLVTVCDGNVAWKL